MSAASRDAFTAEWFVYTMTHDDEMFDDYWDPIDDPDFSEWSVGFDVRYGSDEYHAAAAFSIAEGMTYGMALYVSRLHNEQFAAKATTS